MSNEVQKTQAIRLFDVLLLAPFMGYLALKGKPMTQEERATLLLAAAGTAIYNWINFVAQRRLLS